MTNPEAYTIVASYNLIYGVLATVPIVITLFRERKEIQFRQRRLVSVLALLPLWYWLVTLFLFHLLKLDHLYKLWQGNAVIILVLFVYYMRHLFKGGVWGMRLTREYFDWSNRQRSGFPERAISDPYAEGGDGEDQLVFPEYPKPSDG